MLLAFTSFFNSCIAQKSSFELLENKKIQIGQVVSPREYFDAENISRSGDAYNLMVLRAYFGANNILIKRKNEEQDIERQMGLIENVINSSIKSKDIQNNKSIYSDDFKTWISLNRNKVFQNEVPLYESYSFFYIAEFLYLTKKSGWSQKNTLNKRRWDNILNFVEEDVWTKWYKRSLAVKGNHYWYFLRGRTHMGSNWAGIAMYLSKTTSSLELKQQYAKLQNDYDLLLKRNLKPGPTNVSSYIWNSTYDNVVGTNASETKPSIIQDVSHGNHVVSYIVAAYELGSSQWKFEDITKLCNTFKYVVYNPRLRTFADNVDGTQDKGRPGWGNSIADGWAKLNKYDPEIKNILVYAMNNSKIKKYNKGLQLKLTVETLR